MQEDQLAATPDDASREALLNAAPRERVRTPVVVFDVSRWGEAEWGEGDAYDAVRGESKQSDEDAIIAATAASKADVLVTEDQRLAKRSGDRLRVAVWNTERLVEFVKSDEAVPEGPGPLRTAGRVLQESEWLDLERRVDAHAEVLKETLRALGTFEKDLRRDLRAAGVRTGPREVLY